MTAESGRSADDRARRLTYIKAMTFNVFRLIPGALDEAAQSVLVRAVMSAAEAAPFHRPMTPFGKAMSVGQTSFGPWAGSVTPPAIATPTGIP